MIVHVHVCRVYSYDYDPHIKTNQSKKNPETLISNVIYLALPSLK